MARRHRARRDIDRPPAKPPAPAGPPPPATPPPTAGGQGTGGNGGGGGSGPPVDNQPAVSDPGIPPDTEDSGLNTRDMNMLPTDGPDLTQFEAPTARNVDGMATALAQRPQFSPVAQPGIGPNIWWHTVTDPLDAAQGAATTQAYYRPQATTGIFTRLEERITRPRHHDDDDGHKRKRRRRKKGGDQ